MSPRRLVPLCALLLALAGCGAAADEPAELEGEQGRVEAVIDDLQRAATEGEERRICTQLLAPELARRAGECTRTVATAIDESDLVDITVEEVRISGARATARVTSGNDDEQTETIEFVRQGRDWRIAGFG